MDRMDEWMVFASWPVEDGRRVIFANKPGRGHLVDSTITEANADNVLAAVLKQKWTRDQLMEFLDRRTAVAPLPEN